MNASYIRHWFAHPRIAGVVATDGQSRDSVEGIIKWTAAERVRVYRESYGNRVAAEVRHREMQPAQRDTVAEHDAAVAALRARDIAGTSPPQCNSGKWAFAIVDGDDGTPDCAPGFVMLRLGLPRFLDTSLVDIDNHPFYVSVVAKGKVR